MLEISQLVRARGSSNSLIVLKYAGDLDGKVTLKDLFNFPHYNQSQPNIDIIKTIAEKNRSAYRQFAIVLLSDDYASQISALDKANPEDPVGFVSETLIKWIQGDSGLTPKTWRTLIQCLRNRNLGALANDTEKFFIPAGLRNNGSSPDLDSSPPPCKLLYCAHTYWSSEGKFFFAVSGFHNGTKTRERMQCSI